MRWCACRHRWTARSGLDRRPPPPAPDQVIGAVKPWSQRHDLPVPYRHGLKAAGVCLAGHRHGIDAACPDDHVGSAIGIAQPPRTWPPDGYLLLIAVTLHATAGPLAS